MPADFFPLQSDTDYFQFYRSIHGRSLSSLNTTYLIPVDDDQTKRSELHHRLIQFVFAGRNYVGPVKEALQFGQQRRILDLGTGGGFWAIDIADEFPRAEVIGIDIAPLQPRSVPPNCTFEICDLDQWHLPYPDNHFDFIHARSVHIGIHNYPRFLHEIARLLRPGGLVLLVEPDLYPAPLRPPDLPTTTTNPHLNLILNSPPPPQLSDPPLNKNTPMQGWSTFWDTFRACLKRQNIDVSVPRRLPDLLAATDAYENIVVRHGNIPVGFWPNDPHLLTVGQLQWMDYELLLPALRPLFLSSGLPLSNVDRVIKDAQHDLYYPTIHLFAHLHVVYASKRFQ